MFSAIEALRFMGAIMVVLFHLNAYPSGYKGVDLFFVISGFVLYHRYLRSGPHEQRSATHKPQSGTHELRSYFVHRISKIFLLYWTALPFALLLAGHIVWNGFWKTIFLIPGHHQTLTVSWSLSYELYFYVLFSIFLLLGSTAQRHTLLFALLALSSIITLTALIGPALAGASIRGSLVNFLLGHNTWEFILGLFAGYLFEKGKRPKIGWLLLLLLTALALFCYLDLRFADPVNPIVYGLLSLALVYGAACINKLFPIDSRILTLLGLSTYAIYLFHLILIPLLEKIRLSSPLVIITVITVICVAIYKFYEAPLLKTIRKALS